MKSTTPEEVDGMDHYIYQGTLNAGIYNLFVGEYSFSFNIEDSSENIIVTFTPSFHTFSLVYDWAAFSDIFGLTYILCGFVPAGLIAFAGFLPGIFKYITIIAAIVVPLIFIIYMFSELNNNRGKMIGESDPSAIALGMGITMAMIGFAMLLLLLLKGSGKGIIKFIVGMVLFIVITSTNILPSDPTDFTGQLSQKILSLIRSFLWIFGVLAGIYKYGIFRNPKPDTAVPLILQGVSIQVTSLDIVSGLTLLVYPLFLIIFGIILALSHTSY